jgi:FAD/FMN-containing dehydrogenase
MADGSVISHLGGLEKDNTGYHLAGLLCGSEGTLGIVTAARLRLVARTDERVVALLAFDRAAAAVEAAWTLYRELATLDAAELFLADGLNLVRRSLDLRRPFPADHAAYLLVEAAGTIDPTAALAQAIDRLDATDVAVATDAARRAELWRYREAHTEAINTVGPPHKLDVTLPAPALAMFLDEVVEAVRAVAPRARTWLFGHAADGNVHVNVTGVEPDDESVDDAVLQLVAARGGSISAEHGIGTAKRRWLHLARSPAELAAMRSIKHALDPDGLLNPAVLF